MVNILPIFGLNAFGLRSSDNLMARVLSISYSIVFLQSLQSQSLQNSPFAKQSQYNFKHIERVQWHGFFEPRGRLEIKHPHNH